MRYAGGVAFIAGCALLVGCDSKPVPTSVERPHLNGAEVTFDKQIAAGHAEVTAFGIGDQYSFAAIRDFDGRVKGEWQLKRTMADGSVTRAHGRVTCMHVTGNVARIAGVAERGDAAPTEEPNNFVVWTVQDNDQGDVDGEDAASLMIAGVPPNFELLQCTGGFNFGLFPIERGNVLVKEISAQP